MTKYWCVYCEGQMKDGICVPCHEYKSAVTFEEFVEFYGYEPKAA